MCRENKDQVLNMLGEIGSGKTFNLIHIIDYLTRIASPRNISSSFIFDIIHKSVQLIHLMGSINRQNNMESTACGILLKLGFDDENYICSFNIESKLLDFTLPFSENGRSFTILHAFLTGASTDVKFLLNLPENEGNLAFLRKFLNTFPKEKKNEFKMNELEVWTKFHGLLNFFQFSKKEIFDILNLLSFIIMCNEITISSKKSKNGIDNYFIVNGNSVNRLAANLGLNSSDFGSLLDNNKGLPDLKNSIINLMKYSYFMVFEYIKEKIQNHVLSVFGLKNTKNKTMKSLYFVDAPGEVKDQTLGGLSINIANECLNMFAASQYLSVVEKVKNENVKLKFMQPLHCVDVIQNLIGPEGILQDFSEKFSDDEIVFNIQRKVRNNLNLNKTTQFYCYTEGSQTNEHDRLIKIKFSHKTVVYNIDSLLLESKSLILSKRVRKIFEQSSNSVVSFFMNNYQNFYNHSNFYSFIQYTLKNLFFPIEGLTPFVNYTLHSNDSYNIFFGSEKTEDYNNIANPFNLDYLTWYLPKSSTIDLCKHSLIEPILKWEWTGLQEWIEIENFSREFISDLELLRVREKRKKPLNAEFDYIPNLSEFHPSQAAKCVLNLLFGKKKHYLIGENYVILKNGSLTEIRSIIDKMKEISYRSRKSRDNLSSSRQTSQQENLEMEMEKNKDKTEKKSLKRSSSQENIFSKKQIKKSNSFISDELKLKQRHSIRIQANYYLFDDKKTMHVLRDEDDEYMIQQNSLKIYNFYNFLRPQIQKEQQTNDNKISQNKVKTTEKDLVNISNNIVIAKSINEFQTLKQSFCNLDAYKYTIGDFSNTDNEIVTIQALVRGSLVRKTYRFFRYVSSKVTILQAFARGINIRRRIKKFKSNLKSILFIQIVLFSLLPFLGTKEVH